METALHRASLGLAAAVAIGLAGLTTVADAAAVRDNAGFTTNELARNDDGSTGLVDIGFQVNFFGVVSDQLFVNNNGNVTFDASLATFTPFNLITTSREIIAPFFADVDTRNLGSGVVTYGNDTVNGRDAFGVNFIDVGYYNQQVDKLNSFQLVMIDRSDIEAGAFDFEFNFDRVEWETGSASGGSGGLGGNSARVGFSNGVDEAFEFPGSAVNGAFLDSNLTTGLIHNRLNSDVFGRYVFSARGGRIEIPDPGFIIPLPPAVLLFPLGMAVAGIASRRMRRRIGHGVAEGEAG